MAAVNPNRVMPPGCITTTEACELAGVSYRQLDYWIRNDVLDGIIPINQPGSGYSRHFPADAVPLLELLGQVSTVFGLGTTVDLLRSVLERYDDGCVDFGNGLVLMWPVS